MEFASQSLYSATPRFRGGLQCTDWILVSSLKTASTLFAPSCFHVFYPWKPFFASVGPFGVFKLSSMALPMPVVGENLLAQLAQLELALGIGELSTLPTQHNRNRTPFAPKYAGIQPPFAQQHSLAPTQVSSVDSAATVAALETNPTSGRSPELPGRRKLRGGPIVLIWRTDLLERVSQTTKYSTTIQNRHTIQYK